MVAIGYVSPIPNDPTKVLKAGDTMTGDLLLSGSGTDLTVDGITTVKYANTTWNAGYHMAGTASSGVISGGQLSINANPAFLDISALTGYVINNATNATNPTLIAVNQPAKTIAMDAGSLARVVTWWVMDSAGNVTQQGVPITNQQRRTHIPLGLSAQSGGAIFTTQTLATDLAQTANQLFDLFHSLGSFSIDGNFITPDGPNLSFNKSAGTVFSAHFAESLDPNNPHVVATPAQTPVTFRRITQGSGGGLPAPTTFIDPANYDVGGVVTPVGGGAGTSTIQRVWIVPSPFTSLQISVQYGQATYGSLSTALDRVGSEPYVIDPIIFESAALLGYIVVTRTAVNLSDPSQAIFLQAGKFRRS